MKTAELINEYKEFLRNYKKAQKIQLDKRVEFVAKANQPLNKYVPASVEDRFMLSLYKEGTKEYDAKKLEIIRKGLSSTAIDKKNQNASRYSQEIETIKANIDAITLFQNRYRQNGVVGTFEEYNTLFVSLIIYSHICKKSPEIIAQLLGMALHVGIHSDNENFKKIGQYFNKDGNISFNIEGLDDFERLYRSVLDGIIKHCASSPEINKYTDLVNPENVLEHLKNKIEEAKKANPRRKMEAIQELVALTEAEYAAKEPEPEQKKDKKAKMAMEYVKNYYNNKQVIALCNNFETFKQILDDTNLSESQKKVIKTAMIVEFEKTFSQSVRAVFSWSELMLYMKAVEYVKEPLDDIQNNAVGFVSNSKVIPEYQVIKDLVWKIAEVCDMAEQLKVETRDESDKEYLREEASDSLKRLTSLLTGLYSKVDSSDEKLYALVEAATENFKYEEAINMIKSEISNFADGLLKLSKNLQDTYGC